MYSKGPYRCKSSNFTLEQLLAVALPWGDKRNSSAKKHTCIRCVVENGWSYAHTARTHNVSTKTVINWVSDYEQRLAFANIEIIHPKKPKITARENPVPPPVLESRDTEPGPTLPRDPLTEDGPSNE